MLALGSDLGLESRDLITLDLRGKREGISFYTKTLPLLGKAFDKAFIKNHFELPTNFVMKYRRGEIPAFCGALFEGVFCRDGTVAHDYEDVYSVYVIRQLCYAVNKVDLPYKEEDELRVINDFVRAESEVSEFNSSFVDDDDCEFRFGLEFANRIARELFWDFDMDNINPNVGPGISSNCAYTAKYEKRLSTGMRTAKSGHHFFFNCDDAFERLERYPTWTHFDFFNRNLEARVILVPKDSRGPRLISCEPVENMFLQQGIMEYMVKRLETHRLTKGQVNFTDQSINQRMAIEASMTQQWATLDLKEASDRVSLKLVTRIFSGTPLLEAMLETRTPVTVLPDGRKLRLEKFAPMGSALCFPTMATCLYTLLVAGLAYSGVPVEQAFKSVYVYGDDIIVPSHFMYEVTYFLEKFGLRFNWDKCFIGQFAESCGVDAFLGNDVTPIRLRKCLNPNDPTTMISLVQTAHQLSKAGLVNAAEFLYSSVESYLGILPYGSERSAYLCRLKTARADLIPEANAYRQGLKWKRKGDLQRFPLGWNLKAWTPRALEQRANESMYGRFMRTWRQIGQYDSDPMPFGVFARPRSVRLRRTEHDHYSME